MAYLLYIVPVVLVLVIFIGSYFYCLNKYAPSKKTQSQTTPIIKPSTHQTEPIQTQTKHQYSHRIYEALNINQQSSHPLGAIQTVIRGRIRFIASGVIFIGISLIGLYIFYFTNREFFLSRTPINAVVVTVLLGGGIAYGLQLIYFSTRRILLRRMGFEIQSILGTKCYEYKYATFTLTDTIEHRTASHGYTNLFNRGNFNRIWVCHILFNNGQPPIVIKSSLYAGLKPKINNLIYSLTWVN